MQRNLFFIIVFLIGCASFTSGQDLNHSNVRYSPLFLNPALTGNFLGNIRFGSTYRDQGKHFLYEGYKTLNLYVDSPISIDIRKNDWIGIGLQLYTDKAGGRSLITNGVIFNAAYHFAIDEKYKNVISIGVQYGLLQKKLNDSEIVFESDFRDPGVLLVDRAQLIEYNVSFKDLNIGINYKAKLSKIATLNIGISGYHLFKPNYKAISHNNYFDRRLTLHTSLFYKTSKTFFIKPQVIVSLSDISFNIMPQLKTFYKLKKDKNNTDMVYAGLGYRAIDAIQLMFGVNYKKWDVGIAYDIIVSSAAPYHNSRGGFEIGLFKIIEISKTPKVDPVLLCPEL